MHRAWPLPWLMFAAVVTAVAQSDAPAGATARMSERLAREIRSTLPAYDPAAREAQPQERLDRGPVDPDVIMMREMVVQDRRIAVRQLEERARETEQFERLKRKYLATLSGIGTALNSFTIPLVSAGGLDAMAAGEARREMMRERLEGFSAVANAAGAADPAAGESLKKEIHTLRHGTHPAGWPSIRP